MRQGLRYSTGMKAILGYILLSPLILILLVGLVGYITAWMIAGLVAKMRRPATAQ